MPKQVVGIEIGSESLTIVQLSGTPKAYTIEEAFQVPLPQHPEPQEPEGLQRQMLPEGADIKRLRAADSLVVTLPAHRAILRNLAFPFKDPRRIRQVLKAALEEHMPFDPDEVIADFQPLQPQAGDNTCPLLVGAVPQELIAKHLSLLQEMALEPTIIDLDVFALANAATLGSDISERHVICMDVNPNRILLTVLHHGMPVFARSLMRGLPAADTPLDAMANQFGKQLQQTLYACETILQQSYKPDLLLLSGIGGDALSRLAAALENELDLHTIVWHLSSEHYRPGKSPLPPEAQPSYAVAFGAALRGLYRQAVGLNFRREGFELHRDIQELRGRLIGMGVTLVLVAGLGLFSLYLNSRLKNQRLADIHQEIAQVFQETLPDTRMVQPTFQLREKIREVEERLRAFGGVTGAQLSGLQILREISARIPASITLDVDAVTITTASTDLSGTTASYDNVVQLKNALEASPFFTTVKITNTKTDVENKISFKLTINTVKTLGNTS